MPACRMRLLDRVYAGAHTTIQRRACALVGHEEQLDAVVEHRHVHLSPGGVDRGHVDNVAEAGLERRSRRVVDVVAAQPVAALSAEEHSKTAGCDLKPTPAVRRVKPG